MGGGAIVQLRDGRLCAIESTLGPGQVEAGAAGLLRMRRQRFVFALRTTARIIYYRCNTAQAAPCH